MLVSSLQGQAPNLEDTPSRIIVHVDLDCFYCQVEQKRLGIPREVPCGVQQWEGIIAVNYAARAAGVTRHMRVKEAKAVCPQLRLVHVEVLGENGIMDEASLADGGAAVAHTQGKASLERYRQASGQILALFRRMYPTATLEKASIDEAYLDLTHVVEKELADRQRRPHLAQTAMSEAVVGAGNEGGDEEASACFVTGDVVLDASNAFDHRLIIGGELARRLRGAVFRELGFTVSGGISHNKLLAKLASAMHKPNAQTIVPARSVAELMAGLPLRKIRGLGGKLGQELEALGCVTASDVQQLPFARLEAALGEFKRAEFVARSVRGISDEEVVAKSVPKSMGASKTFPATSDWKELERWMHVLCEELAGRMQEDSLAHGRRPRNIVVSYRRARAGSGTSADRSRSCILPTNTREPPSAALLAQLSLNVMHKCTDALPCSRVSISTNTFIDAHEPAGGVSSFFNPVTKGPASAAQPPRADPAAQAQPTPTRAQEAHAAAPAHATPSLLTLLRVRPGSSSADRSANASSSAAAVPASSPHPGAKRRRSASPPRSPRPPSPTEVLVDPRSGTEHEGCTALESSPHNPGRSAAGSAKADPAAERPRPHAHDKPAPRAAAPPHGTPSLLTLLRVQPGGSSAERRGDPSSSTTAPLAVSPRPGGKRARSNSPLHSPPHLPPSGDSAGAAELEPRAAAETSTSDRARVAAAQAASERWRNSVPAPQQTLNRNHTSGATTSGRKPSNAPSRSAGPLEQLLAAQASTRTLEPAVSALVGEAGCQAPAAGIVSATDRTSPGAQLDYGGPPTSKQTAPAASDASPWQRWLPNAAGTTSGHPPHAASAVGTAGDRAEAAAAMQTSEGAAQSGTSAPGGPNHTISPCLHEAEAPATLRHGRNHKAALTSPQPESASMATAGHAPSIRQQAAVDVAANNSAHALDWPPESTHSGPAECAPSRHDQASPCAAASQSHAQEPAPHALSPSPHAQTTHTPAVPDRAVNDAGVDDAFDLSAVKASEQLHIWHVIQMQQRSEGKGAGTQPPRHKDALGGRHGKRGGKAGDVKPRQSQSILSMFKR